LPTRKLRSRPRPCRGRARGSRRSKKPRPYCRACSGGSGTVAHARGSPQAGPRFRCTACAPSQRPDVPPGSRCSIPSAVQQPVPQQAQPVPPPYPPQQYQQQLRAALRTAAAALWSAPAALWPAAAVSAAYGQPQPVGQPPQPYPAYPQPVPQQGYPAPPQYPPQVPPQAPSRQPPVYSQPVAEPPQHLQTEPKTKAPVRKRSRRRRLRNLQSRWSETEETVPVEFEVEARKKRPPSLFEEALKEGVVKPPKQKASVKPAPVRNRGYHQGQGSARRGFSPSF